MADEESVYVRRRAYEERVYDEVKPEGDFAACRRRLLSLARLLKQFVTFCLSQFGLIFLVVSYSLIGAYVFGQLERPNEKNSCLTNRNLYNLAETSMVYRMWEVVKAYQQLNDFEDATDALRQLLGEFKDTVYTSRLINQSICSKDLQ